MNKQHMIAIALLVAVTTGGGGFFAGTKYQQNKRAQFITGAGNAQGRAGAMPGGNQVGSTGGNRGMSRPVAGEIIKSDDTSITVKLADGSSKIILLSTVTQINKAEQGTTADLGLGTQVSVFGSENTSGAFTAQNIQIHPTGIVGIPQETK